MKIDRMPAEISALVDKYGLNMPRMCYMNSFGLFMQAVSNKSLDINYVLVDIKDENGNTYPHAIIESAGCFYDPTLEPQGLVESTSYTLVKQFSLEEIIVLMQSTFTNEQITNMCNGVEPFWPLQKVGEERYEFVDDGSPTIVIGQKRTSEPQGSHKSTTGLFNALKRFFGF
ncbi:hypothetical protein ACOIXD_004591 [Vibrio parahaemolyticus]|nr:hypothetical protein [Vibrio parahaemolyticus]EIV8627592.1 hypothetical protein [Vibrio parahaemolyticus]